MVTGVDIVHWQIRIARGERLTVSPHQLLEPRGHAIECRVYAEDPDNNFLPSPGRIEFLRAPAGPGIREDSGATAGLDVPIFYDPIVSKLIAWAEDRPAAIARMQRALGEYIVLGIKTTIPFFTWLLAQPEFQRSEFHTTYLDEILKARSGRPFTEADADARDLAAIAAALRMALAPRTAGRSATAVPSSPVTQAGSTRWKVRARTEGLR
jgi:acetyl-CoA carboxylase biotin carboxylase subunit